MTLRARLRRLEDRWGADSGCPECNGIRQTLIYRGYPGGRLELEPGLTVAPPCRLCGDRTCRPGQVTSIVVVVPPNVATAPAG